MHATEFKAWFDGFTEAMDGPPSAKQWERVRAMVGDIDGIGTPRDIFQGRYWPHATAYQFTSPYGNATGLAPFNDLGRAEATGSG